jgi:hypothetical protein
MKQLYLGLLMLFASSLLAQTNNTELIGNPTFTTAVTDGPTGFATDVNFPTTGTVLPGTPGRWYAGGTDIAGYQTSGFQTATSAGTFNATIPSDLTNSNVYSNFLGQVIQTMSTGRYRIAITAKGTAPFYLKISSTSALGNELPFYFRNPSSAAIEKQATPDFPGYSLKITPTASSVTYTADLDLYNTSASVRLYFVFPKTGSVFIDDVSIQRIADANPPAIPTTYFVRPTGNTTAWTGLTGIVPDQIITTTELALTGTYTYYLAAGNYTIPSSTTITTGKVYGGFSGNETNIDLADMTNNPRATSDKDGNGIVEPWEFTNESIIKSRALASAYTDGGFSGRFITVTGGEVNGVTLSDYHYNQGSGNGAIILGKVTSGPLDADYTISATSAPGALKNCTIRMFKTAQGSGTVMMTHPASVVDKCLIEDCRVVAGNGGAIYMNRLGGIVSNSVLRNNIASGHGGAIYSLVTTSSIPAGYTGSSHTSYSAIVSNCAIYNNTGCTTNNTGGSAIRGEATSNARGLEVINCTIVNNTTSSIGNGVASVELLNSGVIVNSIVLNDFKKEIRPNSTTNYVASTIYGENAGSTLFPNTNCSTLLDANLSTINFKSATNFQGAVGNSTTDVSTYTDALKAQIKAANYTITSLSSSAVTTQSVTSLPNSYKNSGGTGSVDIPITATVPPKDMLSVDRATNRTIGAYQYIDPATTVTWNGTAWSNTTGPTASLDAVIDGTYSGAAFNAKKLTVNATKSLTVTSGTMTIQNEVINNGTMVIENNANLIQVNNVANTGAITVKRNSNPLKRLDYTLWASPVAGQNLAAFSPLTSQSPSRFYTYDTANNKFNNSFDPTATNFTAGKGYLIRMPNDADATNASAFAGQFTGVPTNGDVYYTLSTSGNGFNLVGNPYPSPISIANLMTYLGLTSNVIDRTFYFWRKTNGVATANNSAYGVYNGSSSTYATNGVGASSFDGYIQPGQGFFVKSGLGGSLVLKNSFRVANTNNTSGQFFKPKQVASADKIWLNATNAAGDFSQMAVTYSDGATAGVDNYDSQSINDSEYALTSSIENGEYTIQGRPAFDASDVVSLNFKTAVAGQYTIAIDHANGVFAAGQSVILADATTGTETDLTTSAYTFNAPAGATNGRFSLKYQKTGVTNAAVGNENNVAIYKNKGSLNVNAGQATIANITIYDVQGKVVEALNNLKSSTATIENLKATNQVLVVQITLQNGSVVTKKIVN